MPRGDGPAAATGGVVTVAYDYEPPGAGATDWGAALNDTIGAVDEDVRALAERVAALEDAQGPAPPDGDVPSPARGLDDEAVLQRAYAPLSIPRSYERELDLPADPDDPEAVVLEPGDDLEAQLNRDDRRIFLITPGDYTDQYPDISTSGTEAEPRYLVYYDPENPGDDTHPWNMPDDRRVRIGGAYVRPGDWWVMDRIRFMRRWRVWESSHLTLNRMLLYEGQASGSAVKVSRCDHVTVQNCVIGRTRQEGTPCDTDNNCIGVSDSDRVRIVGNELFDPWCGDGIQFVKATKNSVGAVIQDNDIYATPEFEGEPVENAIDLKEGGADTETGSLDGLAPEDWTLVEGNRCWGEGFDMIFHWPSVSGVTVRHNALWDLGQFAYQVSAKEKINREHHVYDNLIVETGGGFKPRHVDESLFARNVFVRARGGSDGNRTWGWWDGADPRENWITRNVFLETDVGVPQYADKGNRVETNAYYGSDPFDGSEPGRIRQGADAAAHDDLTVEVRPYTGPETVTLPDARVTEDSPHADWFDP